MVDSGNYSYDANDENEVDDNDAGGRNESDDAKQ